MTFVIAGDINTHDGEAFGRNLNMLLGCPEEIDDEAKNPIKL